MKDVLLNSLLHTLTLLAAMLGVLIVRVMFPGIPARIAAVSFTILWFWHLAHRFNHFRI
jgi:hypothetical protein